jgi:hypothetical protein
LQRQQQLLHCQLHQRMHNIWQTVEPCCRSSWRFQTVWKRQHCSQRLQLQLPLLLLLPCLLLLPVLLAALHQHQLQQLCDQLLC